MAEVIVACPQKVDASQHHVHRGAVENAPARPQPFEVALEVMRQRGDPVEAEQGRRPLDRVDQTKRLVESGGIVRVGLEGEERLHEGVEVLTRLVDVHAEVVRHVVGREVEGVGFAHRTVSEPGRVMVVTSGARMARVIKPSDTGMSSVS